jgi:uncharacterized protein (TIGR04255 family)
MHYNKAPITEALIDIRVEPPADFSFEHLQKIKERIERDYPRQQVLHQGRAELSMGEMMKAETTQKEWGLLCYSADDKQVFQPHVDGFTFSRLEPYETWERLRDEARRLWQIYRDHVKPNRITRVAVRYLNQFNLPGTRIELEDYLNTYPQLAPGLPAELRDFGPFTMTLYMPQQDLGGMVILNQALGAKGSVEDTVPIILDLDLFVQDPKINGEETLWDMLERLRERKNIYFESCITDKTRELIS